MTQAQEGLQVLLDMAEDYRKKNNMNFVTISAVGGGTGHAYAFQGADSCLLYTSDAADEL